MSTAGSDPRMPGPAGLAPAPLLRGRDSAATKERLLDAAERLFAEHGFKGTSVRAVTRAAGVSVSAANYHFGSKEALLHATLNRVIEPVNQARLARLDGLEAQAADGAVPLEAILDAFLRPAIEGRAQPAGTARFRQVAALLYSDPPELAAALRRDYFGPLLARFLRALRRSLPDRDPGELAIAFEFTVALMVHVISGQLDNSGLLLHEVGIDLGEEGGLGDEEILQRMIRYAGAGLRAVGATREASA